MRMNPDPSELLGREASVDLSIKEISHGRVVERDGDRCRQLLNQTHVDYQQGIQRVGYTKTTDFGWPEITKVDELGPGVRAKQERGAWRQGRSSLGQQGAFAHRFSPDR